MDSTTNKLHTLTIETPIPYERHGVAANSDPAGISKNAKIAEMSYADFGSMTIPWASYTNLAFIPIDIRMEDFQSAFPELMNKFGQFSAEPTLLFSFKSNFNQSGRLGAYMVPFRNLSQVSMFYQQANNPLTFFDKHFYYASDPNFRFEFVVGEDAMKEVRLPWLAERPLVPRTGTDADANTPPDPTNYFPSIRMGWLGIARSPAGADQNVSLDVYLGWRSVKTGAFRGQIGALS